MSEERLKEFMRIAQPKNEMIPLLKWHEQGRKVIGTMSPYVPDELIYAADCLPWRIAGTGANGNNKSIGFIPSFMDPYCVAVLERILRGELDFLDGIAASDQDDALRRLYDRVIYAKCFPFQYQLHVPHSNSMLMQHHLVTQLRRMKTALGEFTGKKVEDKDLRSAIRVCNRRRDLIRRLYQLRKREAPPLSGAEFLSITMAARIMPPEDFISELDALFSYIETRECGLHKRDIRLLVSSDNLDDPRYVALIEEAGSIVAMDDLDTGSRFFWQNVDESAQDPLTAIASRYLEFPACPRMLDWERQVNLIVEWVKEFNIAGVVELPLRSSYPRQFRYNFFKKRLTELGIPSISIEREYHFSDYAQLKTRLQGFMETLGAS